MKMHLQGRTQTQAAIVANKSKHNSDTKKPFMQRNLAAWYDSYGYYDSNFQPQGLQKSSMNFTKYSSAYGGKTLFGDSSLKTPNKSAAPFYPGSSQP